MPWLSSNLLGVGDALSPVAMLLLALLLASPRPGVTGGEPLAGAAVALIALIDLYGLHGLVAKLVAGQIADPAWHRLVARATKIAILVPLMGSSVAIVTLACQGPVRQVATAWLCGMGLTTLASDLVALLDRSYARLAGTAEEWLEVAATLVACFLLTRLRARAAEGARAATAAAATRAP